MSKIYTSVTELIGRTPLIELVNIEKKYDLKAKVVAKLELFNPAGSVKDRVARAMVEDAEKRVQQSLNRHQVTQASVLHL